MPSFRRLVRFEDSQGSVKYGEIGTKHWDEDLEGASVRVFDGTVPWDESHFRLTNQTATIAKVLCPVANAPIIHGVGLNYRRHAEEAGFKVPTYPVMFVKYPGALAGPYEDIPVNETAKDLDYEAELTVVIGRDCKNLGESDNPLDYVLGYMVGNDISSRHWQFIDPSSRQPGYAKSFDKFAPVGPILCSPSEIPDPSKLKLRTWVNGDLRQESGTDDLIFDIPSIIRHLSRGMTLRAGTLIMTGTPSGVGAFMKPPVWLQDGDMVEITCDKIGTIRNKIKFER